MPQMILMDEFHLVAMVPRGLRESAYAAIRRTLDSRRFQTELLRAIRKVVGRYPTLRRARFNLER
jgi:hypothetical protein